jgi:hypothetical protein
VLGLASSAVISGLLLRSWRWAVVSAAVLVATPLWTGHGMFNTTDIPVAAGYTLVTLGVVLLVRAQGGDRLVRALVTCSIAIIAGTTLAVGTRPATWPAMIASLAIPLVAAATLSRPGRRRGNLLRTLAAVLASAAITAALLLAIYPAGFSDPLRMLGESVSQSARFGDQGSAGSTTSLAEAAGYLPSWLAVQLPLVICGLFVAGTVASLVLVARVTTWRRRDAEARWRAFAVLAVGAQLLVLPIGAALMRSNVYDGVRQFLFIVPMIAIVATIGIAALLALAARLPRGTRILSAAIWILVAVGLLAPTIDQFRLFPYGYAYVNEVAAREPIDGRLPTDYWRTSMRELIPQVPASGETSCTFDPLILGLVPIDCANQGQLSPYWDTRGSQALDVPVPPGKYLFLESNRGRVDPGPGCTVVSRVTRTLHGQELTMSYAALCDAPCVIQEAAQCDGKDLSGAVLDGLNLRGSSLADATLRGTSLILADLSGANLSGADLTGAILDSADLTGANLQGADLTGANLTNAKLTGADLTGAIGYPAAD